MTENLSLKEERFAKGIVKLVDRFGAKAFGNQFRLIIWDLYKNLEDPGGTFWNQLVKDLIGKRKHSNPPLEPDFREAIEAWLLKKKEVSRFDHIRMMKENHAVKAQTNVSVGDGGWAAAARVLGCDPLKTSVFEMSEILKLKMRLNKEKGFDEYRGLEIFRQTGEG